MFRILQLHKTIRRFTSVGSNVVKITTQPARFYSSALAALKEDALAPQSPSIQNVLLEIQNNLKRWGRITNKQVLDLTDCVSQSERVNSTQALAAIRCFTDLSIDMKPENRIKNVDKLWKKLEQLCVHLEVGHYNALLRAYLDSEHNFNPTDFLSKMAENGVGPNRITYQFLVERYCQTGDVDGATRIMRFMEEKQVPITQNVLNLMIMGHARNNDMESAEKVIDVMKSKGLSPDETTYGLLLAEYARKGDVDSILKFFGEEKNRDVFLDSRTVANIIFELVSGGHADSVQKVMQVAPAMIQNEFHRLVHRLVSSNHHEACIPLLVHAQNYPETFITRLGTFVVTNYAGKAKSAKDVLEMIKTVPQGDLSALYTGALRNMLGEGDVDAALELISAIQKDGVEIRSHCYFPLISRLARSDNIKELANTIISLKNKLSSADVFTVYKILKAAGWQTQPAFDALLPVRRYGVSVRDCLIAALSMRQPGEAKEIASQPLRSVVQCTNALVSGSVLRRFPENALVDVASCIIARGLRNVEDSDSDAETTEMVDPAADATPPAIVSEDPEEPEERENASILYSKLLKFSPQELTDHIVANIARKVLVAEKCTRILDEFATRGLGISKDVADELIRNCKSDQVKAALQRLAETELDIPDKDYTTKVNTRLDILEEYLKNDQLSDIKTLLQNKVLVALCELNDSRAIEVFKELGDNISPSSLGAYIRYACNNDTSLGLDCWSKYSKMRGVSMHFANLATKLINEGKVDDALAIIVEKKDIIKKTPHFRVVQNLLVVLNTCSDERCRNLLQELVGDNEKSDRSLYVGHLNLLIRNNQLVEAVDLFENSIGKYGRYGVRNLGVVLIEREQYELLQRLQNILTSTLGEEESLYELSLVLLKCRKVRQAKRIIELSGQPGRVIRRVLIEGDQRSLESLVEVLPPFHSQRDELCEKLLEIYDKKNDAENALALHTRFEEINYTPSVKFQIALKNLLRRCGYEVPFDTSALSEERPTASSQQAKERTGDKTMGASNAEEAVFKSLDNSREAFIRALSNLDTRRKHEIVDDLVRKAIREKNFDRLAFVIPGLQRARFDIFLRALTDESIRQDYVELMESHVQDMPDLLKAYWFDLFLKGDDKACEDLWLKHALYSMIHAARNRSNILRGHEERYFAFFEKIQAPPESKVGAFVALAKKKIADSPDAGVEFLEKQVEMVARVHGPTFEKLRKLLVEQNASAESLSKYDALVKKHGVNVNEASA